MQNIRRPNAFLSCSLDSRDASFVQLVEALISHFGFEPFGTIGKFSASPEPIWQQMKKNIQNSDCLVLAATPRFIRQDIRDKSKTGKCMSDLLNVELGMAIAFDRPVLAFVEEGTDMGSFLPQVVQYITLRTGDKGDLQEKLPLISNYFRSALSILQNRWQNDNRSDLLKTVSGILAVIGGAVVVDALFGED